MRNKLIGVMCLAYMAAAAAGQVPVETQAGDRTAGGPHHNKRRHC